MSDHSSSHHCIPSKHKTEKHEFRHRKSPFDLGFVELQVYTLISALQWPCPGCKQEVDQSCGFDMKLPGLMLNHYARDETQSVRGNEAEERESALGPDV